MGRTLGSKRGQLARVFTAFGFGTPDIQLFLKPDQVVRMGHPPLRIEVLTSVSGLDFLDAYTRRENSTVDGVDIAFIGLPDLKVNKAASGRLKDLNDLQKLP